MYKLSQATGSKELNNHIVTINADKWTFMNIENNLPSGSIFPVESTVYDLRRPTQLNKKKLYNVPGGGYNHNFCISSPSVWSYRFHARYLKYFPIFNYKNIKLSNFKKN